MSLASGRPARNSWTWLLSWGEPCKNREGMSKYLNSAPLDAPTLPGREEHSAVAWNRLCSSSLCRLDRFGLQTWLLLRVVRHPPGVGLRDS